MTTKTYKVASNRGHKRVWIEGKILLEHGFQRGMKFARTMSGDRYIVSGGEDVLVEKAYMKLQFEGEGKHTIAGTPERPIIDLNGKYLDALFEGFTHYTAEFWPAEEKLSSLY